MKEEIKYMVKYYGDCSGTYHYEEGLNKEEARRRIEALVKSNDVDNDEISLFECKGVRIGLSIDF